MRGELLDRSERSGTPGRLILQNERMLKVDLTGTGGYFMPAGLDGGLPG